MQVARMIGKGKKNRDVHDHFLELIAIVGADSASDGRTCSACYSLLLSLNQLEVDIDLLMGRGTVNVKLE